MYFSRYLDTIGDGSGTKIATGNYSGAAQDFLIKPGPSKAYAITRLIIFIEDNVAGGFNPALYGGRAVLANGIILRVYDADGTTILNELTDSISIKNNGQWQRLCFDVSSLDNNTNVALAVRWTFDRGIPQGYGSKSGNTPIKLEGNQKLVVRLNDDFSDLLDHTFLVQGWQT